MKVAVTRSINCAHTLPDTQTHGHTYRVTVTLRGSKKRHDSRVMPFVKLGMLLEDVLREIDHQNLDAVLSVPTAENLAEYIRTEMTGDGIKRQDLTVRVQVGDDGWVETE